MREIRRSVDDPAGRSRSLWARVQAEPEVQAAAVVMTFASIPGEPDTAPFVEWCRAAGKRVLVPESNPSAEPPDDPESIDVMIVPGLAFTAAGDRLGQGGGWYDRVLSAVRDDCLTIGVCFAEQLVDEIPTEPHDVRLDRVHTA